MKSIVDVFIEHVCRQRLIQL